jgi:hypothetical protein
MASLGSIPFPLALISAGIVPRSSGTLGRSDDSLPDVPLIALVAVFLALPIAGVLEPEWPPRRVQRAASDSGSGAVGTAAVDKP